MPIYRSKAKRTFKRRKRIPKRYYNRSKKMVTGQAPTLLEKIASGVGTAARVAGAVLPMISAINTEMKYYDVTASVSSYDPGTNDTLVDLTTGINQGTGDSDRIGNSVLAKNITLKIAQSFTSTVGTPNVMAIHGRMTIFCWKENFAENPPTVAKVYQSPSNIYSPLNKDYSDQLVLLKDKFFVMENFNGLAAASAFKHVKFYKDLGWHLRWDNSGGNGTVNHIFMILRSTAPGSANALNTTYYSRLNYTDN